MSALADRKLSAHFTQREFDCGCGCQIGSVDPRLVEGLELLRAVLGSKPLRITSGIRCVPHNKAVGGAPNSQHIFGRAADIVVEGVEPKLVFTTAEELGVFGGLGLSHTFVHVDVRPGERTLWAYDAGGRVIPFERSMLA